MHGLELVVVLGLAVLQGRVVRWAQLPGDSVADERAMAAQAALADARAAVADLGRDVGADPSVIDRIQREYDQHLAVAHDTAHDHDSGHDTSGDTADGRVAANSHARALDNQYSALHLALIARKRATTVRLRDEHRIDDTVLRQMQTTLDLEELGLTRRAERSQPT